MKRKSTRSVASEGGQHADEGALLGTVGVARLLNVHPKHVYRLLRRGLPAQRLGGEWRYDANEVRAWLQRRSNAGAAGVELEGAPPLVAANGDVCIEILLQVVAEATGEKLGFVPADRTSGRSLVESGSVVAAGVHGIESGATLEGLVQVHVTRRQLGLAFPKSAKLRSLTTVVGSRLASRAITAGIRSHFDAALREQRADPDKVNRRAQLQASHRDVVLAILSGKADAGIVSVAWADRAGLGFLPFAEEDYSLCLRPSELARPSGRALVRTLQSRELRKALGAMAGYDAKDAGELRL